MSSTPSKKVKNLKLGDLVLVAIPHAASNSKYLFYGTGLTVQRADSDIGDDCFQGWIVYSSGSFVHASSEYIFVL